MVPHIVYDPGVDSTRYFPGPDLWDSKRSPHAPRGIATSGITQPPIHARVALEMHRHALDLDESYVFLRRLYTRRRWSHGERRKGAEASLLDPAFEHIVGATGCEPATF